MIVDRSTTLRRKKILARSFLLIFLALILFPILMVVSVSFRKGHFSTGSPWPRNPTIEHWVLAFGRDYTRADGRVVSPPFPVMLWLWNSIKIGVIATVGVLAVATISACAFSRIRIRGKGALLDSLFLIQMFPTTLALVAIYAIFDALGRPGHNRVPPARKVLAKDFAKTVCNGLARPFLRPRAGLASTATLTESSLGPAPHAHPFLI